MNQKKTVLAGRLWIIADDKKNLIDDIDTDMIFHNAHLAITDIKEMGKYAFGNLKEWEHFAVEARPGDIVMAGRNFGSGSSRQQAVDCFVSLGIQALICESYGAIYKRNAINSGFPILIVPELIKIIANNKSIIHLMEIKLDLNTGTIDHEGKIFLQALPLSKVQIDLYIGGGLLKFRPQK
jgi:3-isopropylmalate/(R)-2-methylmalate dehydratase small subunit